jgi:toxin-antitoxin system PIN domain toxin
VTLLDANILLYAYDSDAPQHASVSKWLSALIQSEETIALPWVTIWAFLRISTNPRLFANPKSATEVFAIIRDWLALPGVSTLDPGTRHSRILEELVSTCGASGPMVTDAVLAALALENGATLASTDHDFARFPDLRWVNPLRPA